MSATHYSREDFQRYDSQPWKNGDHLRFLCLECGDSKPRDRAHRSLRLRLSGERAGLYLCERCGLKGKVTEEWAERPRPNSRSRALAAVQRTRLSVVPPRPPEPPEAERLERLAARLVKYQRAFVKSPGAAYLKGRGIPEEVAELAGVGYAANWEHWEEIESGKWELLGADRRVVFPVYDRQGSLVAISGRAIDAEFCRAKFISQGPKSLGLFTSPGALSSRVVAVCEAAIDALALWLCGVPAVAGIGATFPEWLPRALAFKHVLVATDADDAGDKAAETLSASLRPLGSKVLRMRASVAKDWGASLEVMGAEALRKGLIGFAEESDDFERICHADDLSARGHAEGARFVSDLIEDSTLRMSFRASVTPGVLLWHRAFRSDAVAALCDKFGAEVYAVEVTQVAEGVVA